MNGSHRNRTLKTMMNRTPVKNVGRENPMNANVVASWSNSEYCFTAERTPIGTARQTATRYDEPTTHRSVGRRCRISRSTGTRLANEYPQSPCRNDVAHFTYRIGTDWSSPSW